MQESRWAHTAEVDTSTRRFICRNGTGGSCVEHWTGFCVHRPPWVHHTHLRCVYPSGAPTAIISLSHISLPPLSFLKIYMFISPRDAGRKWRKWRWEFVRALMSEGVWKVSNKCVSSSFRWLRNQIATDQQQDEKYSSAVLNNLTDMQLFVENTGAWEMPDLNYRWADRSEPAPVLILIDILSKLNYGSLMFLHRGDLLIFPSRCRAALTHDSA